MGEAIRWRLSVAAWWLWLKVTPDCTFKRDMVDAVASLRARYPHTPKGPLT